MNVPYLIPRLVRHFLPEKITRALLLRGVIIRPGLETRSPKDAAARYQHDLSVAGVSLAGKHVLVFGYGGRFNLGCQLLQLGASRVTLCEYAVRPDESSNAGLLPEFEQYLAIQNGHTIPRSEWFTLLEGDIREIVNDSAIEKADIVCSTSVFEHLSDPPGILSALARLTRPGGTHIHFIDLRDHFFKYPFEMLTFSSNVWKNWLNPTSNLNRWRLPAYSQLFESIFSSVDIDVFERNLPAWEKISTRVLPEFKTGEPLVDSVTQIRVIASGVVEQGVS